MEKVLKDKTFQELLKKKQRLEMMTMTMPFIGILALFLFLYFFKNSMVVASLIILVLILLMIIGQYLFQGIIIDRIDATYIQINRYFQMHIVPKLLQKDNPTFQFDQEKSIDLSILEEIESFNHYKKYHSRFHYDVQILGKMVTFDELLFSNIVTYNTKGIKEIDERIDVNLNYHVYRTELDFDYGTQALFIFNEFEELSIEDIRSLLKVDLDPGLFGIKDETKFTMFASDTNQSLQFLRERIVRLFRQSEMQGRIQMIYIKDNALTIIFEEYENLINTPHSKRFTIEKLFFEYKEEQQLVKRIIQAFEG